MADPRSSKFRGIWYDAENDRVGLYYGTGGASDPLRGLSYDGSVIRMPPKLDLGVPGTGVGQDIGEGGSYKADKDGAVIVKAYTYDASATSGSRFTAVSDIDSATTFLSAVGDRLYIGSPYKFWGVRFNPTTAVVYAGASEVMQAGFWNGSALTACDHMVITKADGTGGGGLSVGEDILKQTALKEYLTYDNAIDTTWATADDVTDKIPNDGTNLYWLYLQVPASGLSTPPIVDEIRVRGSDHDFITGGPYQIFWGKARVKQQERVSLSIVKSPAGTGVIQLDIDSAHKQTLFNFNGVDNLSFMFVMPKAIDTSNPIEVTFGYSADANDTFDLVLSALKLRDNTTIGSGVTPDYTSSTAVTPAAADKYYKDQSLTATKISIQDMTALDAISFGLERTDTTNAIYPMTIVIHYVVWAAGEHL